MSTVEIVVPVDVQRFSQNQRKADWRGWSSLKKEARDAGRVAWIRAGRPQVNPPAVLHITTHRARWLDYWNIPGACKSIIDGMCWDIDPLTRKRFGLILPDDGPQYLLPGRIRQIVKPAAKGRELVQFLFEECSQEATLWHEPDP